MVKQGSSNGDVIKCLPWWSWNKVQQVMIKAKILCRDFYFASKTP
jgi:hypothetical protein